MNTLRTGLSERFRDEMGLECKDICVQLLIRSKWRSCICTLSDKIIVDCNYTLGADMTSGVLWVRVVRFNTRKRQRVLHELLNSKYEGHWQPVCSNNGRIKLAANKFD